MAAVQIFSLLCKSGNLHQFTEKAILIITLLNCSDVGHYVSLRFPERLKLTLFEAVCDVKPGLLPIAVYRRLLSLGANLHMGEESEVRPSYRLLSPLHYAGRRLNYPLYRFLIASGANPRAVDGRGLMPTSRLQSKRKGRQCQLNNNLLEVAA